jgi:hypothetical protein
VILYIHLYFCVLNRKYRKISTSVNNLVLAGNAYNNFTDTIKSKRTLEEYKHAIVRFMRFLKVTDVNNLALLDAKEAQQKIRVYRVPEAGAPNSSSHN